jgi:hypothetical protein
VAAIRPLRLFAEVRGVEPAVAALLAALDGHDVWLGGKRSKGMGRCRLTGAGTGRLAASPALAAGRRRTGCGWRGNRRAGKRAGDADYGLFGTENGKQG